MINPNAGCVMIQGYTNPWIVACEDSKAYTGKNHGVRTGSDIVIFTGYDPANIQDQYVTGNVRACNFVWNKDQYRHPTFYLHSDNCLYDWLQQPVYGQMMNGEQRRLCCNRDAPPINVKFQKGPFLNPYYLPQGKPAPPNSGPAGKSVKNVNELDANPEIEDMWNDSQQYNEMDS